MEYKIGNKVNAIIRSYRPSGDSSLESHAPYTQFSAVRGKVSFSNYTRDADHRGNRVELRYNNNIVDNVTLYDVPVTEKVLAMCFQEATNVLYTVSEENTIRYNKIILKKSADHYYNIYVYKDGELLTSIEESTSRVLNIDEDDAEVLVFYELKKESAFILNKPNNCYVTLDLTSDGNNDDTTSRVYMHFEKCAYLIDNELNFNYEGNTVTLTFKVLNTEQDYIIFE